jgi:hypothetical protein
MEAVAATKWQLKKLLACPTKKAQVKGHRMEDLFEITTWATRGVDEYLYTIGYIL